MKSVLWGRRVVSLTAAVLMLFFMIGLASARTTRTEKKADASLKADIAAIDGDTAAAQADQVTAARIAKAFKVTPEEVLGLRDRLRGLGEVAAVYAFADTLKGGVTGANIATVMTRHEAGKDWGAIAKDLKVDLRRVADKVNSIEKDVHRDIKKASTGKSASGTAGGGVQRDFSDEHYQ